MLTLILAALLATGEPTCLSDGQPCLVESYSCTPLPAGRGYALVHGAELTGVDLALTTSCESPSHRLQWFTASPVVGAAVLASVDPHPGYQASEVQGVQHMWVRPPACPCGPGSGAVEAGAVPVSATVVCSGSCL